MGVTKLLRKAKKNKTRAKNRVDKIKNLLRKPEVKNVDMEAIKAEFAAKKQAEKKAEAPKAEKVEKTEEAPKQEVAAKNEESAGSESEN